MNYTNSRCIRIIGEISEGSFEDFSKRLNELESQSDKPVHVEVCSGGGLPEAALAFYSRIRLSKVDVYIYVYGHASSAASLIVAAGDKRFMTKEAWIMVHEENSEIEGDVKTFETEVEQMRRAENAWNDLLASRTKTTARSWAGMNHETTYLTAEECLELGLIDEIV